MTKPTDVEVMEHREFREFWAESFNKVVKVTGYSCAPTSKGWWWCPSIGVSAQFGIHLFDTELEALKPAIQKAEKELRSLSTDLSKLRKRLKTLQKIK